MTFYHVFVSFELGTDANRHGNKNMMLGIFYLLWEIVYLFISFILQLSFTVNQLSLETNYPYSDGCNGSA